tara:strand:+ start:111 stop:1349 length:1239 start_codon:yes stop_codon:yes gene_type:complete
MLNLYKIVGFLIIPLIMINLRIRVINGKEDKNRFRERYGITKLRRPKGKIIWIHAASVGEFKSASVIINNLSDNFKILVTTTTLSAAIYAKQKFGKKIIHQYAPLDIKIWIERFINNWKPDLSIWIESDLWPVTLKTLKEKSIKSILLNLRISPKSFEKWLLFKNLYTDMLSGFNEIFVQSLQDQKRIKKLTNLKIKYIGNLKLSESEKNTNSNTKIKKYLKKNKIIFLASTHKNEEKQFFNIINYISKNLNNYKIIIAPRHPERSEEIISDLKNNKIDCSLINKSKNFKEKLFIINTFGQMQFYFSISDIVFLGGSLVKMGGHNPIEPARNNCAIITGPNIFNWHDIYKDMEKFKSCLIFNNIKEIENFIKNINKNNKKLVLLKRKAREFSKKNFFDTKLLFKIIKNNIKD